jgi:hypothetical protein
LLGERDIFTGIRKIFPHSDDRFDTGFAGPVQNCIPIFIVARIAHMGMGVHQFWRWYSQVMSASNLKVGFKHTGVTQNLDFRFRIIILFLKTRNVRSCQSGLAVVFRKTAKGNLDNPVDPV